MRAKKTVFFITALLMTLMSTGCWDAKDINEKALVTMVLTDMQDGLFVFYVEVPNLEAAQSSEGGAMSEQFGIITGSGGSYAEARRSLNSKMDKPAFLGSTRSLVITDELARHGILEYMFRMQNMVDYRRTLNIVTTTEDPKDFLSVTPENNVSIGYSVHETIEALKNDGKVVEYTVSDVLDFLCSNYCFVLANMDVSEGRLAYNGYTIIHQGKYLGFIPIEESYGLVWLLGDNIKRLYVVPNGDYTVTVEVSAVKRDIRPVYANGRVGFNISFKFDSKIQYISDEIIFDEQIEMQVKNNLQSQLLKDITDAINQSLSYQCDYLGFKERFRVVYPNIVGKLDWSTEYPNAEFTISAETSLKAGGMMDLDVQVNQAQ